MTHRIAFVLAVSVMSLAAPPARAEVKAVDGRNAGAAASGAFRFDAAPSPLRSDGGRKAKVTVVDGTRDRNGADAAALVDGRVPANEDQPAENFFFAQDTDGGRIMLDFGEAAEVKQVNTYSWHRDTRGPQVYKLYGSDGSSPEFSAEPKRATDPSAAGWTLLAAVDTRPKEGAPGGQYAVSVADTTGAPIGRYRYLLLDVSRTQGHDAFGNTFYSEIDVVTADDPAPAEAAVAANEGRRGRGGGGRNLMEIPPGPRDTITANAEGGYEIVFDVTETPDLKGWVDSKLKPVCVEWYPKIVAMLPSEGFEPPKKFTVLFRSGLRVPAMAAGNRVACSAEWMRRNLDGEAAGAVVHELVHVVQQYGGRRNRPGAGAGADGDAQQRPRVGNPGWLVEGLADYIRWFLYEAQDQRPRPRADRANYNDSYRTTGHFLNYVMEKYDQEAVKKLNAAMREGRYGEDLWKEMTGKTVEELGEEWKKTL